MVRALLDTSHGKEAGVQGAQVDAVVQEIGVLRLDRAQLATGRVVCIDIVARRRDFASRIAFANEKLLCT